MTTQTTERLLLRENEELRRRLAEAEETLRAIRAGEVDAVLVEAECEQVFTLESADKPYRLLVEQMPQGAATLSVEGVVLYCNRRFADLLKQPLQALLGKSIHDFVAPDSRPLFETLLRDGQTGDVQGEVIFQRADDTSVPVYLGVSALQEGVRGLCLIVTDLTEQAARKKTERFADRIARLQQVTVALSEALTVDQVAEAIIAHGLTAVGANVGVVATLTNDGSEFVNLRIVGYSREVAESWSRFPADAPLPMADAARLGRPIVLGTLAERDARYPELVRFKALEGDGALAALPLLVLGRAVGAMRLAFPTSRVFTEDDMAYMLNLAQLCAQALERARLYDAERRARAKAEQEIEERKRAEAALRESEARFRHLVFALPAAMYTTDREGRITLFNDRAAELWGRRPEIGKDLWCGSWRILRPDGTPLPHDQCPMALALHEGRSVQGQEIVVERPDGTRVCVLPHAEPLYDASGAIVGAVNMLVDITDRRQMEEVRSRLAAIVESSNDAIIAKNLDGTITNWNKGAERIFGYSAEEIVGRPITTLTTPESPDDPLRILERIRRGERVEHYETLRRTKDGRTLCVSLTVSPVRDSAGQIIGASKIARDITEQKRLEEALRDRTRQLAEADRRKDEFLAMLAHELRNPLAPLRNAAQVLQLLGPDATKFRWATDVVNRQVQLMTRLVDDLLDVARIARGKVKLQKGAVELRTIVARAVETSSPLIDARKHDLTISLPSEPVWLEADPARLAQVLINLLNNAAKYTEEGGRIGLTAEREGSAVVLRVRDTGVGIPPEVLPHVFDLFTQEGRSQGRSQEGLGIGLALVRGLVEMHEGSVEATSPGVGRGSEFTVRVPALPEAPGAGVSGKQVSAGDVTVRALSQRILVVDDNRDSAESLAMLLQMKGHEVQTAQDGLTALEAARNFRPAIILLDIGLPRMNGYEVARRLHREHGRQAILVAVTGYGTDEDQRRSREAGFDYHLVKPLDLDALHQLLIWAESSVP
jgi:PAS domain S-box-containing protein